MKYIILRGPNGRFIAKALRPEFSTPIIGNPVIIESEQEPTQEQCAAATVAAAQKQAVPRTISNWRCKVILKTAGLLDQVIATIDALPEPTKTVVQIAWESGADIERHGATLVSLAPALGLTDEQVDTMFIQADALRV